MSLPTPPHYTAYRVLLVLVLVAVVIGIAWWLAQPNVLYRLLVDLGLA